MSFCSELVTNRFENMVSTRHIHIYKKLFKIVDHKILWFSGVFNYHQCINCNELIDSPASFLQFTNSSFILTLETSSNIYFEVNSFIHNYGSNIRSEVIGLKMNVDLNKAVSIAIFMQKNVILQLVILCFFL